MIFFIPSRILFYSCLTFICGVFVWSIFFSSQNKPNSFSSYIGKKVVVTGFIVADPLPREKNIQLVLKPEGKGMDKVLVMVSKFSRYQYGDRIKISGKLEVPPVFDDFNYRDYLATKRIYALMWFPKIELLERGSYGNFISAIYAKILYLKHAFANVLQENLSPPYSSLLGAFVLGDQSKMSDVLKQQLNVTGLRHIIAISGQHIVIITGMLEAFLLAIGFWRKQAILVSALFMVFFIVLTGAESSAVRSGIMGGFLFLGQYLGRMHVSFRGLVYAATGMLFLNPTLLLHDIGFQLSFLAVLGIIVSFSFFQKLFHKIPEKGGVRDMLAMNFSAQLLTAPILIYNFGYISIIGIITNLLILPIAPILLGLGFVFLAGGALWSGFGFLLSFPVFFLLYYFNFVIEFFAKLPFASLTIENLSPLWLLLFYGFVFFFLWKFKQNQAMI